MLYIILLSIFRNGLVVGLHQHDHDDYSTSLWSYSNIDGINLTFSLPYMTEISVVIRQWT